MCVRCVRIREETLPTLFAAMCASDDATLELLGKLLELALASKEWNVKQQAERVEYLVSESHEGSRFDVVNTIGWLMLRLHAIKARMLHEIVEQEDTSTFVVEWNREREAFRVRRRDLSGAVVDEYQACEPGEGRAFALLRITNQQMQQFNEDHKI